MTCSGSPNYLAADLASSPRMPQHSSHGHSFPIQVELLLPLCSPVFFQLANFQERKYVLFSVRKKMSKFILKLLQPREKSWPLSFSEENCNRDFCECGLWVCLYAKSLQSCLTLWGPVDYSLPGSLEFSRQEYWPGCHAPLQRIFMTQRLNLHLSHLLYWQAVSLDLLG